MAALFALASLSSGQLLGIVARSRVEDLRARFTDFAAPTQSDGTTAEALFDKFKGANGSGRTVSFDDKDGGRRSYILVKDEVIMGRETIVQSSTGRRAPVTLQGVVIHELTTSAIWTPTQFCV